jgi:hypothetical protein
MLTDEFRKGVHELLEIARQRRTAILCAEGLFWRCHRRLVSDFLMANGVTVQHIMPHAHSHCNFDAGERQALHGGHTFSFRPLRAPPGRMTPRGR